MASASKSNARIFRYVVAYDAGCAPRPFGGVCSLAICKPRIRAKAEVGDWVVGFRSRHPGEVLYAMQVTERMPLGEYWADPRYADRRPGASTVPDNFYRPAADGTLEQVPNGIHDSDHVRRDVSGRHVLLSRRFWYFGRESVPLPNDLLHLVHTTQGHAVDVNRRPDDAERLAAWLAHWPVGLLGQPSGPRGEIELGPSLAPIHLATVAASAVVGDAPASRPNRSCGPPSRPRPKEAEHAPDPSAPARIVLSRKGFDSGYGGMPSPILPDGRLVPLPIPAQHDSGTMADLGFDDVDLPGLLNDLSGGRHSLATRVHIDPDLNRPVERRRAGWRPALGQTGAAQSHLATSGVGPGDVFLFFGWFRQVEQRSGRWRFVPGAPNQHVLFGWLEVDEVRSVVTGREDLLRDHPWAAVHPHVANPAHYTDPRNTIYIAPPQSRLVHGHPGGGLFPALRPELLLTAPGRSRSVWSLPSWFMPRERRVPLSYHGDAERWQGTPGGCLLRTVAKGQEFVLQAGNYPEAPAWLAQVIRADLP